MVKGILGKKIGMTRIFDKEGNVIPVTVVEAGPCPVLALKEEPKKKVMLGFLPELEGRVKKPRRGFFKKIGVNPTKVIREFDSQDNSQYTVGQNVTVEMFKAGDFVDVSSISKGKGFQGGMKRWHWNGGPAAHGSMHHRRVGSIGSSATPSRTLRGMHMPGHMGAERVTTQGLRVMDVDVENNLILVKGSVPGYKNCLVEVNLSFKKKYESLDEKPARAAVKRNPMKQSKSKAKGKK